MVLQSQLFRGDQKLEAAASLDPAHIFQGASGPHVAKIQHALIQLDGEAIARDGNYGPGTAAAVSAFKQKRQIFNLQGNIDNIVGRKTIAALDSGMLAKERGSGALVGFKITEDTSPGGGVGRGPFDRALGAAKGAMAIGAGLWVVSATFENGIVNGVTAAGGQVVSHSSFQGSLTAALVGAGVPAQFAAGVGSGTFGSWLSFFNNYSLPALPLFPSFAAVPSSQAPPTPGISVPLSAGVSTARGAMQLGALANAIRFRVGASSQGLAGAEKFIVDFSLIVSNAFNAFLASAFWAVLLGQGPVPSFAPPNVPFGPVVGGSFRGGPGSLSGIFPIF